MLDGVWGNGDQSMRDRELRDPGTRGGIREENWSPTVGTAVFSCGCSVGGGWVEGSQSAGEQAGTRVDGGPGVAGRLVPGVSDMGI